jgi:hypothetical protein
MDVLAHDIYFRDRKMLEINIAALLSKIYGGLFHPAPDNP